MAVLASVVNIRDPNCSSTHRFASAACFSHVMSTAFHAPFLSLEIIPSLDTRIPLSPTLASITNPSELLTPAVRKFRAESAAIRPLAQSRARGSDCSVNTPV